MIIMITANVTPLNESIAPKTQMLYFMLTHIYTVLSCLMLLGVMPSL